MKEQQIGRWAFVIGLIISILLGFMSFNYSALILVILGLIVGFLNVSEKEASKFLIATIALMVVGIAGLGALNVFNTIYTTLQTILGSFSIFVAAASLVVAIKVLFETAKGE